MATNPTLTPPDHLPAGSIPGTVSRTNLTAGDGRGVRCGDTPTHTVAVPDPATPPVPPVSPPALGTACPICQEPITAAPGQRPWNALYAHVHVFHRYPLAGGDRR